MAVVKMSIHRALSELKTYADRIEKSRQGPFVAAKRLQDDKISNMTLDEIKNIIIGNYATATSLIENYRQIKSAIVRSNADTIVKIGGKDYSVAEAIERKASIVHSEKLLKILKDASISVNHQVDVENKNAESRLEQYLQSILGDKDKRTPEDIEAHTKAYDKRTKWEVVDPCDTNKKIEALEKEISDFKTEVDYTLSESNATTFVEINFVD